MATISTTTPSAPLTKPPLQTNTPTATPSPGTWRHPQFHEITRRQRATTFTDQNLRKIVWNGGTLLATFLLANLITSESPPFPLLLNLLHHLPLAPLSPLIPYTPYPLLALRILLTLNILLALSPLFRPADPIADIPLTPSQRHLLGLAPHIPTAATTPPITPGSSTQYITPPRYRRSITPRGSGASAATNTPGGSASPLGGAGRRGYNTSTPTPTMMMGRSGVNERGVGVAGGSGSGARDEWRRGSFGYGYGSPLRNGGNANGADTGPGSGSGHRAGGAGKQITIWGGSVLGGSVFGGPPTTPSPKTGRTVVGSGVPLSSRWLYEKGRSLSDGNFF